MQSKLQLYEKKLLTFVLDHIDVAFVIVITLLSIGIRIGLAPIVSNDADRFLLPWYDTIKQSGGFRALSQQTGDYCMFYQTLIALFTYLPVPPLAAYKLLSCIFDYLLAAGCLFVVKELTHNRERSIGIYVLVVCSPIVVLNSAAWAQCDSMYAACCIWTLYFCLSKKYTLMLFAYGFACTMKLQAIFFLPFLIFIYLVKKEFSILKFLYVPAVMIILSLGGLLSGRHIWDILSIYFGQMHSNGTALTRNYPGLWALFSTGFYELLSIYGRAACLLALCALGAFCYYLLKKHPAPMPGQYPAIAFLFVFLAVLTLPRMHERYGYLYEILALILAVLDKKTIVPCIVLHLVTFCTYAAYLTGEPYSLNLLAAINILLFLLYFWLLMIRPPRDEALSAQ